jgi:hypothetical protein
VYPPPAVRGEDTLAGWRGGRGVNILEDPRHSSEVLFQKVQGYGAPFLGIDFSGEIDSGMELDPWKNLFPSRNQRFSIFRVICGLGGEDTPIGLHIYTLFLFVRSV